MTKLRPLARQLLRVLLRLDGSANASQIGLFVSANDAAEIRSAMGELVELKFCDRQHDAGNEALVTFVLTPSGQRHARHLIAS